MTYQIWFEIYILQKNNRRDFCNETFGYPEPGEALFDTGIVRMCR
jgi:hypothetical protein